MTSFPAVHNRVTMEIGQYFLAFHWSQKKSCDLILNSNWLRQAEIYIFAVYSQTSGSFTFILNYVILLFNAVFLMYDMY